MGLKELEKDLIPLRQERKLSKVLVLLDSRGKLEADIFSGIPQDTGSLWDFCVMGVNFTIHRGTKT